MEKYEAILEEKLTLRVYKKDGSFDFQLPIKIFKKINSLYNGKLISMIRFMYSPSIKVIQSSLNKREYVVCFSDKNEIKINDSSVEKITNNMGLSSEEFADYLSFQVVNITEKEIIHIYIIFNILFRKILDNIYSIKVNLIKPQKDVQITGCSLNTILRLKGLKYNDSVDVIKPIVKNFKRDEQEETSLAKKAKILVIRKSIFVKGGEENLLVAKKDDVINRMKSSSLLELNSNRKVASDFLKKILEQIEKKKIEVQDKIDNDNNILVKVKDINNQTKFIQKIIFDKIVQYEDPDEKIKEFSTNDINGNKVSLTQDQLIEIENEGNDLFLVQIKDTTNSNNKKFVVDLEKLAEIYNDLTLLRQQNDIFPIDQGITKITPMKTEIVDFPGDTPLTPVMKPIQKKVDTLWVEGRQKLLTDLQDKKKKDLYFFEKRGDSYILYETMNTIRKRDLNVENKNISYKLIHPIFRDKVQSVSYADIFKEENPEHPPLYLGIVNKDSPEEKIIVDYFDLVDKVENWKSSEDNIILSNGKEINPLKIVILKPTPVPIPENYEKLQKAIKNQINNENIFMKTFHNNFIKKDISEQIINNRAFYENYNIKDYKGNKIKVNKNELSSDINSPNNNYVLLSKNDKPNEKIIIEKDKFLEKLEQDPMDPYFDVIDGENHLVNFNKLHMSLEGRKKELINIVNYWEIFNKELNDPNYNNNFYKIKDKNNQDKFIFNDYINIISNDDKNNNDNDDTEYQINDINGNKITIKKIIINNLQLNKNNNSPLYVVIKDKMNGQQMLVDKNIFLDNLKEMKSAEDDISIINELPDKNNKINNKPFNIKPKSFSVDQANPNRDLSFTKIQKEPPKKEKEENIKMDNLINNVDNNLEQHEVKLRAARPKNKLKSKENKEEKKEKGLPNRTIHIRRAVIYMIKKDN